MLYAANALVQHFISFDTHICFSLSLWERAGVRVTVCLFEDIVIPESYYPVTLGMEVLGSLMILGLVCDVLAPV